MESTDFDAARNTLLAAVVDAARMEYSSLSGDAKDHDRYAYYTVRVPVKLPHVLAAVGEAGSVLWTSARPPRTSPAATLTYRPGWALEAQRERLNALADQAETTITCWRSRASFRMCSTSWKTTPDS